MALLPEQLQTEFEEKETAMKNEFESKLEEIKKKYGEDLNVTRNEMIAKLKKDYGEFLTITMASLHRLSLNSIFGFLCVCRDAV